MSAIEQSIARMPERPLHEAGWAARSIAGRPDVSQEPGFELRIFVDPEHPDDERIVFWMWMPGWEPGGGGGQWMNVWCDYTLREEETRFREPYEAMLVGIRMPDSLQQPRLMPFYDEAIEGWGDQVPGCHGWVDQELLPKGHDVDWRVLSDVPDDDQTKFELVDIDPLEGEEAALWLVFEDLWDLPYDARSYAGRTKEEYLRVVCDALSRSWRVVTAYLSDFLVQDVQILEEARARRMEEKPPHELFDELRAREDVTDIEYAWLMPETGVEPDKFAIAALMAMTGSEGYPVILTVRVYEKEEYPGAVELHVMFSQRIQETLASMDHRKRRDVFADFVRQLRAQDRLSLLLPFEGIASTVFDVAVIQSESDQLFGFHAKLYGVDTQLLVEVGYDIPSATNRLLDAALSAVQEFEAYIQ